MRGGRLALPGDLVRRLQAFQRRAERGRRRVDGERAGDRRGRVPRRPDAHAPASSAARECRTACSPATASRSGARRSAAPGRRPSRAPAVSDWARCRGRRRNKDAARRTNAGGGRWSRPAARSARQSAPARRRRLPTSGCRRPARSGAWPPTTASAAGSCRSGPARFPPARRRWRPAPWRARSACPPAARSPPARAGRCRRCGRRARPVPGCARDRRSRSPIWRSSRTPRGSRVPGTPRARACARADLADEHDHRRGILARDVDAGRGIGGARPARDEADAGAAGRLADRLGHHGGAALVPADGERDRRGRGRRRARPDSSRPARRTRGARRGSPTGRSGFRRRSACRHCCASIRSDLARFISRSSASGSAARTAVGDHQAVLLLDDVAGLGVFGEENFPVRVLRHLGALVLRGRRRSHRPRHA